MMKYETVKVFDCQAMPVHTRKQVFENYDFRGNGCYMPWEVQSRYTEHHEHNQLYTDIDEWLQERGANYNETVLIYCWW